MTKGEETRQMIIKSAAPIFNKKGIAATAMSDIMDATKLSKGSLYVHFENKDELVMTVVDYNMQLLGSKVFETLRKARSAREKLIAYIDVLSTPVNPIVEGGCPMLNFGMEADDTNEVVTKKVNEAVVFSQQIISDIIKKGIDEGEFSNEWNYKDFALVMFAMIEGGQLICRVARNNRKMQVIKANLLEQISRWEL
ncbi:TetR/AcrR family transcriptional regulator [Pedobacter frigiditerrae]|uniref:TetR/AcrR family transcriptional regulator n=1 Tax=Pedobacter frigiditerrae TaxID=2530452 RepID=A0A4R0MYM6_9SPHI|nr:TetR/AcrR family transcriptional regulator [Pedobacter frigiditerrae]TCC92385.1 TetR/AcrR family transcriptional regulator [Pedobacter frigiditerrae]